MPIMRLRCAMFLFATLVVALSPAQEQGAQEQLTQQQSAQDQSVGAEPRLRLAGVFGSQMVLQQQTRAPIWGTAKPGVTVSVNGSWSDATSITQANEHGNWRTNLATPVAGGPFQVIVKAGAETIKLDNVLAGEVWVCSGQSNMQWKMRGFGLKQFADAVAKANQPQIRYCQVPQILALEPKDDIQTTWSVCSPKSVLGYSAVAYFFANRLHQELGVPIGLVASSWGGTPVEAWMSEKVLSDEFPEFTETRSRYPELIKSFGASHSRPGKKPTGIKAGLPCVLHNQMIRPLIPFAIRGVIWYQGESNVGRPEQYRKLFPSLIRSWREQWSQGEFPFYFVQIAPYHYRRKPLPAALLREAQFQTLSVPNTGMAVTMDVGEAGNIHPKAKQPVGERLALIALARDYGHQELVYSGPAYSSYQVESGRIRIRFAHVGGGLLSRDGAALSHFAIAGKDKSFVVAKAVVEGDTIVVHSDQVQHPVAVRFAWGNADCPNLMNREGLPCSSFRTDDWHNDK